MSSRNIILNRLRNGRSMQKANPRPQVQRKVVENPIEMFQFACEKSNTTLIALKAIDNVPNKIREVVGHDLTLRMWQVYSSLDWQKSGISPTFGSAQNEDKYGLTGVDYAVCATGTLVLQSSVQCPQSVAVLPEHHFAIVRKNQLVERLSDAVSNLTADNMPAQVAFISGPSRTADIEQTLVLGAHGPLKVTIFLI